MKIRTMNEADWTAVSRIYEQGIRTGIATFEASPPPAWADWISRRMHDSCIVCDSRAEVIGWAALSPVSSRYAYRGVAEVSIYVATNWRGMGAGSLLLTALIALAEQHGMWTLQAQMFPENRGSMKLHAKHGFRVVGVRERIGKMSHGQFQGQWKDNVLLERRSRSVGV